MMNEELLRAARSWQEDHKEWQKRYSQWLLEQNQWESQRFTGGDFEGALQRGPSTSRMASRALVSAMKKAVFMGRRATVIACTKAAHQTRTGLLPAAKKLVRSLAALARSRQPSSQDVHGEDSLQQHQQQLYLLNLQRHQRLREEQFLQQQQSRVFLNKEARLDEQEEVPEGALQPQLHRHSTQQQQQQQQQQQPEVVWQIPQQEELQGHPNDGPLAARGAAAPASAQAGSNPAPKASVPKAAAVIEATNADPSGWVDEEEVLGSLNSSIDWIVDVGLNSAARAAAASALQRREKLLHQQQMQGKTTRRNETGRGSSVATCCDSVSSAEELHEEASHHLSRQRPLVQTARPQCLPRQRENRSRAVGVHPRSWQDTATDCSLEDCVIHHRDSSSEGRVSDSSTSSSCLARRLTAARRLRAAAAAAKRRQVVLAQRRTQAAKRDELCYGEIGLDCAL